MSRFFKYVDQCPDIPGSLPDHIMEGDSESELEFETLLISDNSTEIINAPIEIITVPSSEDELEDADECIPSLAASEVTESSGDEGEADLDVAAGDLDETVGGRDEGLDGAAGDLDGTAGGREEDLDGAAGDLDGTVGGRDTVEPEKSKVPLEDDKPIPQNIPVLEEAVEEEDEFTKMWSTLGLQPDRGQVNLVKENWKKIKGRIELIWQDLRQVIIDAFKEQGRMTYSEEEHQLKEELALVTNMSLIMEQRMELLQLFAMRVEFGPEY